MGGSFQYERWICAKSSEKCAMELLASVVPCPLHVKSSAGSQSDSRGQFSGWWKMEEHAQE